MEALPLAVSLALPGKGKGIALPGCDQARLSPTPTGRAAAAHGGWARVAEMGVGIFFGRLPPPCAAGSSVTHILHHSGRSHALPQRGDHQPRPGAAPQHVPRRVGATLAFSPLAPHLSSLPPALLRATM